MSAYETSIAPHPDCKAAHCRDHKVPSSADYIGPTHACAGPNCPGEEHRKPGSPVSFRESQREASDWSHGNKARP
jgi:hypothetical protein